QNFEIIKYLIEEKNMNPAKRCKANYNCYQYVIQNPKKEKIIKYLFETKKMNVKKRKYYGKYYLKYIWGQCPDDSELIRYLVEEININIEIVERIHPYSFQFYTDTVSIFRNNYLVLNKILYYGHLYYSYYMPFIQLINQFNPLSLNKTKTQVTKCVDMFRLRKQKINC
ncbi:MAG: hypothetical protein Dasosvirus21_1, partial [Dasosvirus sp.]